MPKDKDNDLNVKLAVLTEKVDNIDTVVKDIKSKLENNYATKEWVISEYGQTKKIVNGLIVTVLVEVLGAILALVILRK